MTTVGKPLKVLYVGARVVGKQCLRAMLDAGLDVAGLLYLSDDMAGITVAHTSFQGLIDEHQLHAKPFRKLSDPDLLEWVQEIQPDVGVVVGVSQLINEAMLSAPRYGFVGMHPTMLPEGRGRAPIPWALIKGLEQTGVSLFWCEPGADTGDLLSQRPVLIHYEDTASILGARTDDVAAELLVDSLTRLRDTGVVVREAQDESKATNWPKRTPDDGVIDWSWSGRRIYDWVRSLTRPYPGAFTSKGERRLFVWACRESADARHAPLGTVLGLFPHGILVACGDGCVLLNDVQWSDSAAEDDLSSVGLKPGDVLG